jgi:hypothetical protein
LPSTNSQANVLEATFDQALSDDPLFPSICDNHFDDNDDMSMSHNIQTPEAYSKALEELFP